MRNSLPSKTISTLALLLLCFTASFAQWVKQTLPTTIATPALEYPGLNKNAIGKNYLLMITRNNGGDTTRLGSTEAVRTSDGGKSYQVSKLPFNNSEYFYAIQVLNAKTSYVATTSYVTGETDLHRSIDSGATWQSLNYHPTGFLNAAIFYDANNGIAILDPDSLGAYMAYTTNGGNTFTRISQNNVPRSNAQEVFWGGGHQTLGDVIFQPAKDNETGLFRFWRSTDRGRNWTAGEWVEEHSPFGPNAIFTDKNNGFWINGQVTPDYHALYTTDGGNTWKESGELPGVPSGGNLSYLPNTENIVYIFEDTKRGMLFSAATNDFGKSWHSKKDLVPYKLDSIYVPFDIPPFGWSNLDIIDNNTAWAKFSRTELYRYDSSTPIIPEQPDLELTLKADNNGLPLYGYVKYTLSVRNRGISPATGVKINWLPPYNRTPNAGSPYAYVSAYADKGRYDSWNGVWTLDKLDAGAIGEASFHLFVLDNKKNVPQTAQITACNERDLDSSPNNMVGAAKEDDEVGYTATPSIADLMNNAQHTMKTNLSTLSVSPNPTADVLNIAINNTSDSEWSVKVVNTVGQTVFSQNGQYSNTLNVDVKNLPNGLYLIDYQSDNMKKVERVFVRH